MSSLSQEGRGAVRQLVNESRAKQGLPPQITDPKTLEKIAAIIRPADEKAA